MKVESYVTEKSGSFRRAEAPMFLLCIELWLAPAILDKIMSYQFAGSNVLLSLRRGALGTVFYLSKKNSALFKTY